MLSVFLDIKGGMPTVSESPEDLGDLIATTSLTTSEATRVGAIQAKQQARKTDNHHPEPWTVGT